MRDPRPQAEEAVRSVNEVDAELGETANLSPVGLQLPPEQESGFNPEAMTVAELGQRCAELEVRLDVAEAERWQSRAVLASLALPVIVTDPFEELVLMSHAAAELFGIAQPEMRTPIVSAIDDADFINEIIATRNLSVRGARRQSRRKLNVAGGVREFNVVMVCVCDLSDGRPSPWGVITFLEPVVDPALPVITPVSKPRAGVIDFVEDLRAPLASLRSYAALLLEDGLSDAVSQKLDIATRQRFLHHISAQVDHLLQLTESLTLMNQLDTGSIAGQLVAFEPAVSLQEAVNTMMPQALSRRLSLVMGPLPSHLGKQRCLGDPDLFRQALLAAIANGIKYTTSGGKVTAQITPGPDAKTLRITISDTGVGIDPKDLPEVFDKFDRNGPFERPVHSGVGLPIVKRIIETLHQGQVSIESVQGSGTTLHIDLPLFENLADASRLGR